MLPDYTILKLMKSDNKLSKTSARRRAIQNPSLASLIIALLIICIYIAIAVWKIRYPGTQYDEALYVNAALGGIDKTTFMTRVFHKVPILLMPYIGALKSYIYFPIFKLFGVSAITMRVPQVILTAFSLFILHKLIYKHTNSLRIAISVVAITAFDASFIIFTRLDNGPVVLDLLLKLLALLALFYYQKTNLLRYQIIFWLFMWLGIFNKLNFIWYVNAFTVSFLVVYGRQVWEKLVTKKRRLTNALVAAFGFIISVGYFLLINHTYKLGSSLGWVGLNTAYHNTQTLISGSWFYNYVFSPNIIGTSLIFWLGLIIILGSRVLSYINRKMYKKDSLDKYAFENFIGIILTLIFLQLVITLKATAGWHYFSIYPFWGILVVIGIFKLAEQFKLKIYFEYVFITVFCIYGLFIYAQYIRAFTKPSTNIIWSTAIYDLENFAKTKPNSQFISLDWGTQTQLIGLGKRHHNRFYELFGPINSNNPMDISRITNDFLLTKPDAYYVTHSPGNEIFPGQTQNFLNIATKAGYSTIENKTIYDQTKPVFVIYRFSKP